MQIIFRHMVVIFALNPRKAFQVVPESQGDPKHSTNPDMRYIPIPLQRHLQGLSVSHYANHSTGGCLRRETRLSRGGVSWYPFVDKAASLPPLIVEAGACFQQVRLVAVSRAMGQEIMIEAVVSKLTVQSFKLSRSHLTTFNGRYERFLVSNVHRRLLQPSVLAVRSVYSSFLLYNR